METLRLKTIAASLCLAALGTLAALGPGTVSAANCPEGNTDPNCPNRVKEKDNAKQQQEQQRAKQQQDQQAQQRAQQEQQKAQQQSQQRAQQEQQRAKQQQDQQAQQRSQQRPATAPNAQAPQAGRPTGAPGTPPGQPSAGAQTRPGVPPTAAGAQNRPGAPPTAQVPPSGRPTGAPGTTSGQPPVGMQTRPGVPPTAGAPGRPGVPPTAAGTQNRPGVPPTAQVPPSGRPTGAPGTTPGQPPAGMQTRPGVPPTAGAPGRPGVPPTAAGTQNRPGVSPTAQLPVGGRPPVGGGARVPPAKPVAIDTATTLTPRGDRSGFDIRRKNNDGSQTVITQKVLPDGSKRVSGFKQTENARDGTTTRIYSDGQRLVQGRDFERRSTPSGLSFVSRRSGLREAVMPDGRAAFQDRFTSVRDAGGRDRQVIERTRYARWWNGRPEYEPRPVIRRYDVGHIHGVPVAQYRPSYFAPDTYQRFRSRFTTPVILAGIGVAAVGTWIAFNSSGNSSSEYSYTDPVEMMGDMQISSGFQDGYAYATPVGSGVYDTPEAAALRAQMASVQQQVGGSVAADASLQGKLGGADVLGATSQVQQAVGNAVPVQISEEVRQQVRKQVRLSVAMHQNGKPDVLNDVLSSGYARIYLFQTAQPLNTVSVSAGGECFLNTGDLIGFARLPASDSTVAEMKVVASAANSCRAGDVIQVPLTDLQEMLNGFSERVEDNMKKVTACAAKGRC